MLSYQFLNDLTESVNFQLRSSLAVQPSLRRSGLGRRLLRVGLRRARRWKCDAVELDVYDDNLPATSLYSSLHFKRIASTPQKDLELQGLLGRSCGRWRLELHRVERHIEDIDAEPSEGDRMAELLKRILYQVSKSHENALNAFQMVQMHCLQVVLGLFFSFLLQMLTS